MMSLISSTSESRQQRVEDQCQSLSRQFNDLLDQIKSGACNYRSRSELSLLLDDVVERVDRRMVARYGHGFECCPHKECPLGPTPQQVTLRVIEEASAIEENEYKQSQARQIVTSAVSSAFEEVYKETPYLSYRKEQKVTPKSRKVLKKLVRFEGDPNTSPETKDNRPFAFAQSSSKRTNQQFSLRREARNSLPKYASKSAPVDAMVSAFVTHESEDEWEDAVDCQYDGSSSTEELFFQCIPQKDTSQTREATICFQDNDDSPHDEKQRKTKTNSPAKSRRLKVQKRKPEEDADGYHFDASIYYETSALCQTNQTYAQTSRFHRSSGKFTTKAVKTNTPLLNVFDNICADMSGKQNKTYRPQNKTDVNSSSKICNSVQTSCNDKHQSHEVHENKNTVQACGGMSAGTALEDSGDEDEWDTPPDYEYSTSEVYPQLTHIQILPRNEDYSLQSAYKPNKGNMDSNLVFSVRRTLRDSLPKFTGYKRRVKALMHLADNYLHEEQVNADNSVEDKMFPYLDFDELRSCNVQPIGDGTKLYLSQRSTMNNKGHVYCGKNAVHLIDKRSVGNVLKCCSCASARALLSDDDVSFLQSLKESICKVHDDLTLSNENVWKLKMIVDRALGTSQIETPKHPGKKCKPREIKLPTDERSGIYAKQSTEIVDPNYGWNNSKNNFKDTIFSPYNNKRDCSTNSNYKKNVPCESETILCGKQEPETSHLNGNVKMVLDLKQDRPATFDQKQDSNPQPSTSSCRINYTTSQHPRPKQVHFSNGSETFNWECDFSKSHSSCSDRPSPADQRPVANKGSFLQQVCGCT